MLDFYESQKFDLATYADHILEIKANRFAEWKKYTCDLCSGMEINGQIEWDKHLQTRKHKNKKRNIAKNIENKSNKEFYADKNNAKNKQKEQPNPSTNDDNLDFLTDFV